MRYFYLLALLLLLIFKVYSQPIRLKTGTLTGNKNLAKGQFKINSLASSHFQKKYYAVLQFEKLPEASEKAYFSSKGVILYDYIPGKAYLAELPDSFSTDDLKSYSINGIYPLPPSYKLSPGLDYSIQQHLHESESYVAVRYFGSISKKDIINILEQNGAEIETTKIQPLQTLFVKPSMVILEKLAALPFVSFLSLQILKDIPLNYNNHAIHALDALCAPYGRNLLGKNVTVGVGDNADPSTHIDFAGRLIDRNPNWWAAHGTHTTGTTGGGGILNPMYRGMAPMSTLISQNFSDILVNAPIYIPEYNMVLTNNSYFSGATGCPGEGEYDALANYVDQQIDTYDSLLHVFASGNDGDLSCSPYPLQYATVKSGFQCAKNVITVGAMNNLTYAIAPFSSAGPVNDGRLKPEIVAGGVNIISTYPLNTYGPDNGTSMASPTVTGTLALLYERYKQLHNGANPSSALIKAVVCNSADDLGNPGPDFAYGFGMLNARTAVETIENNQYFNGTISQGGNASFTISGIPAGAQQVKIMLYWNDPAAAPYAATALVNNLNLTVTSPDGTLHHPLILNPNPNNVTANAVEGIDTLNNIQQVVVNTPATGNFTVQVNGANIPQGPQAFVLVYQIINPSVKVEYPYGNETWVPGETEYIRWSAYGTGSNTFNADYSLDSGMTWRNIATNIASTARSYAWTVPDTPSNKALVRVTAVGTNYSGTSTYGFIILGQPTITLTNPCQGYVNLLWNTIGSATQYEIMELNNDSMLTIATTSDTTYLLKGLNRDSTYYFTVRADNGTSAGRRGIAVSIVPDSANTCVFNNYDFSVDSLIGPITGRQYTSTALNNSETISIELKNLGGQNSSQPIPVSYQINGGAIITENIPATVNSGTTHDYSFNATADFSQTGPYIIKAWVSYPGDSLHENDTITTTVSNLSNDTISLSPSFTEGFESAAAGTYYNNTHGFVGLDRCDFYTSNSNGRVRTFIDSGFARTGDRCATLDQVLWSATSTADSLIMTFNLSNYKPTDQIWLNFFYRNQGIDFSLPGNTVWIRGSDQGAWIAVDTLSIAQSSVGVYLPSSNIDVKGILASASPVQQVSSSFQIKFGEEGYYSANSVITDGDLDNGYSYDDITFTKSSYDVGMLGLIAPNINGICNLSNAETIQVKVKNYSPDTLNNVQVSYSINGTTVTETIPSIAPNDTLLYTFSQTVDLSAYQTYNLGIWVYYPLDDYRSNDSLLNIIFNTTPLINTFPYLEGFENNNGYWYTNGINDDWQWGTPQKQIINKAANGTKCWVTSLTGNYSDNEMGYLYSPCFDLSSLSQPVLSFSHIFQTEDDCDCDYHWVEYSTDGINWQKLGYVGAGTNWYDNSTRQAWQISDTIWHVSSFNIPTTASKVQFRIVMYSDPATNYEGVAIDDVHIFDKDSVYKGPNLDSGITQTVSGTGWINFNMGNSIVAALNPNGQNLGNTTVKVYMLDSGSRNAAGQYYLDRNIVIQPEYQPTDTVGVRFYFTDAEADSLINANGCSNCTSIHDAYESGITQYSHDPQHEDSTLNDNTGGVYRFNPPRSNMTIIPNDNGYYAEYKVTGFSEFWINGGGPNQDQPLALVLLSFTANKVNDYQALLQWNILSGTSTRIFYIQKSRDSISFTNIDSVNCIAGTTAYQYTDSLFNGVNYYRLLIIDSSGNYQFSNIESVSKDDSVSTIMVYPNPVINRSVYVKTPDNCRYIQLCDQLGRMILTENVTGVYNEFYLPGLASGIYFVIVQTDSQRKVVKVFIQ